MAVGVPMYAKWFNVTDVTTDATPTAHIGASMGEWTFENSTDGSDLNKSGTYLFNATMMGDMSAIYASPAWNETYGKVLDPSWARAQKAPVKDAKAGATSFFDDESKVFWTWTSVDDTKRMCSELVDELGGVMVW
jgi:hypothetical protein